MAELGTDIALFLDADHAATWAGLAPGQNESAGNRKRYNQRGKVPAPGLDLGGLAASHTKSTFPRALYRH